ncbi:MAG: hypothetical protein KGL39_10345 [Patescibacteria group bacterium]|nr:hypothetical protein [Patescibacteria group bacterium]
MDAALKSLQALVEKQGAEIKALQAAVSELAAAVNGAQKTTESKEPVALPTHNPGAVTKLVMEAIENKTNKDKCWFLDQSRRKMSVSLASNMSSEIIFNFARTWNDGATTTVPVRMYYRCVSRDEWRCRVEIDNLCVSDTTDARDVSGAIAKVCEYIEKQRG